MSEPNQPHDTYTTVVGSGKTRLSNTTVPIRTAVLGIFERARGEKVTARFLDALPAWIDSVLSDYVTPLHCDLAPENVAAELYRTYSAERPPEAAEYLIRCLDFSSREKVAHEIAVLMFCGALAYHLKNTEGYCAQTFTSNQWSNEALGVSKKEKAKSCSASYRTALVGHFYMFALLTAQDTEVAAVDLRNLWNTLKNNLIGTTSPEEKICIGYLSLHLLWNSERHKWPENSPLQALVKDLVKKGSA